MESNYKAATYAFGVTFVALALSALLFSDKFPFLQNKTASNDSNGKCPQKCCSSCSLNLPLVLIFSAGLGVASSLVVMLLQKHHRDSLRSFVSGATGSGHP
jgi:hypothetical protein